jgi:hypothetical protein
MDTLVCTHSRYDPEELVYRTGSTRGTTDWEDLTHNFKVTFNFEDDAPSVDTTLQIIKNNIFTSEDSMDQYPYVVHPDIL